MKPLTIFSWGYAGWGNATKELVRAVNAVERERKFEPPLFVDIRIQRGARAVGFREKAFEAEVGFDRYLWMNDLGNRAIQTGEGWISINNPKAAEVLLVLALENAKRPRRVIFFCSCGWPILPNGPCHRTPVGKLLLNAAARRQISAEVVEWPGEEAKETDVKVSAEEFRKVRAAATIPLGRRLPPVEFLKLGWGSLVTVRSARESVKFFTGPAQYQAGRWVLPKIYDGLETEKSVALGPDAGRQWRQRWGFESRSVGM